VPLVGATPGLLRPDPLLFLREDLAIQLSHPRPRFRLTCLRPLPGGTSPVPLVVQLPQASGCELDGDVSGLRGEVLVAPGQLGLLFQWPQLPSKLRQHVLESQQVLLQAGELSLGPLAPASVLGDARGLLHELAALFGPGLQHSVELSLPDDRVQGPPDARIREQLLDVQQPARPTAESILALPRSVHRAADLDLRGGDRDQAGRVIDDHAHLGHPQRGPGRAAGEDHVGHLPAAERPGTLFTEHPGDRIDDVRLARPIGAHHHAGTWRELQGGLVREGLEAPHRE
jgi:hypothetical protein